MGRPKTNVREMFDRNTAQEPNTGCWIWLGSVAKTGYGQYRGRTRNHFAHRLAYRVFIGNIPKGAHLHHVCETPLCVNPGHLKPLTPGDHIRETLRINGADYLWKSRKREQTHCKKGHRYTSGTTYSHWHKKRGKMVRECLTCVRDRNKLRATVNG